MGDDEEKKSIGIIIVVVIKRARNFDMNFEGIFFSFDKRESMNVVRVV